MRSSNRSTEAGLLPAFVLPLQPRTMIHFSSRAVDQINKQRLLLLLLHVQNEKVPHAIRPISYALEIRAPARESLWPEKQFFVKKFQY